MQLPPSQALSTIVKHYLVLESHKTRHLNYRLFSDGNPGIVFHYKDPFKQYFDGNVTPNSQPRSFMYGQITRYNDLVSAGNVGMVVVVLQPYGIYSLLGLAADELNNNLVNLTDLYAQEARDLEELVESLDDVFRIIAAIEKFLLKKITSSVSPADPAFRGALQLIYQSKGLINIEGLLKKIPVTERQLERKFKQYTGLSPYKFSEIVKFQHFLKLLQSQSANKSIGEMVYDAGYYDHSHLNNWFRKNTGITPSQYRDNSNLLAINFMQLQ